jgi:hypothetical protein
MNSRRCIAGHAPDALNPSVSDYAIKVQAVECPSWVKSAVLTLRQPLPVYPDKQTFSVSVGMPDRCHNRTPCTRGKLEKF